MCANHRYDADLSPGGCHLVQIKVICGDEECRTEFPVSTDDPEWECPSCGRVITNRRYPFLTARLMQGTIDRESANWKELFRFLLERAETEIAKRSDDLEEAPEADFLDKARSLIGSDPDIPNEDWRTLHDDLLLKARETVLILDERRAKKN